MIPGGVNSPVRAFRSVGGTPFFTKSANGARLTTADDQELVDFVLTWGPAIHGHNDPDIRAAIREALDRGTSFGTPNPLEVEMAELILSCVPAVKKVRMTNSGTEATMSAIRLARGYTGRNKIIKFSGCYHGHVDSLLVKAGSGALTQGNPDSAGVTPGTAADTLVAEYNNLPALSALFDANAGQIAGLIVEPFPANVGLILPDAGFLAGLRELCTKHGTVLIFDEVKTGITAGWGGATGVLGVQPDLIALAKSIGGGFPIGAFGGKAEYMDVITTGKVMHLGTYNGNPLVMAAARAVLSEVCTPSVTQGTAELNERLLAACNDIIVSASLPAHTVQFGAKGCITWSVNQVRNYRDYKETDFDLAFAQWIHGINRGVLLPPGLDEQWLISVMHTDAEVMHYADVFQEFVSELTH